MPLWFAALLLVFLVGNILIMLILARRKGKKDWMIPAAIVSVVMLLGLLAYILLTFIFIFTAKNAPPIELPETCLVLGSETLKPLEVPEGEIEPKSEPKPEPEAKPADYDLPTADVPVLYPDILGLTNDSYEEMPTFGTQNDVTKYVLFKLLNNQLWSNGLLNDQFECEFYLTKAIAMDPGTGFDILGTAYETAMSYYLFSAYKMYDMFTEDLGDEDKVYAKIKVTYTDPEYDLEARAEAFEFIMKNPIPIDGFEDFETEKAYAQKIHDFIIEKVTYSPIGYDPEGMVGLEKYEALQEAYNALGERENTVVCAGYARAFALIAQYAGINAAWVLGNETETQSHAWNAIYPCDGSEPVLVDVTWDDTVNEDFPDQKYISDRYFYIPLSVEYEHTATDDFEGFLSFMNKPKQKNDVSK